MGYSQLGLSAAYQRWCETLVTLTANPGKFLKPDSISEKIGQTNVRDIITNTWLSSWSHGTRYGRYMFSVGK